ncbi:hypothetical protein PMAC_003421 [Pneumocystis sp. 'macacae']|nr:hypothetical protein PMAC_003421 [Pneumocystis sp. 'macacae']
MLHGSNATWLKALQKELVKVCTDLKEWSNELFMLCLDPKKNSAYGFYRFKNEGNCFREDFNEKRLYPTKNDCEELEENSKKIEWLCYALDQHCNRLRSIEQLEKELLEENKGYLKDENSCMKEAKKRCNKWLEKGNDKITRNVKSNCTILEEHIKNHEYFDKINGDGAEEICERWTHIKEKKHVMESAKINDKCALFLEKKKLGDKLIDKFKGSLSNDNDCMTMLDKYCIQLTNKTIELEDLCTNTTNTKNNTEQKNKAFMSIREKAEKMNTMNLVLLTSNNRSINEVTSSISNSTKNTLQSKLKKKYRDKKKAFDLYVKLNMSGFNKGCEFKKECKTESLCEEIEKVTVIQNTTVITIKTQTTEVVKETQLFLTTEKYKPTKCTTEGETGEIYKSRIEDDWMESKKEQYL